MSKNVQQMVETLSEVYQDIYGHPEWTKSASRDCYDRVNALSIIYEQLAKKLSRPLRVIDLGCAQGFFCLSLAERGAIVKGFDLQEENIAVCRILATENPQLKVSFSTGRIEDILDSIEPGQYDLAIGLSIFHHIIHLHGLERTQYWLSHLAYCTEAVILELALRGEPLYWGPSQPADPRELLRDCAFFHEITRFKTHLSAIYRPLYVVSHHWLLLDRHCDVIEQWYDTPYVDGHGAHHGSRRYYFGKNYFCKIINFNLTNGSLLETENQRNKAELQREYSFLKDPPPGFITPTLLGYGISDSEGWLITERLEGELLHDIILRREKLDHVRIIDDLLKQLILLEQAGLYHDDLRSWNILINKEGKALLIDFGSISTKKNDCVWPYDLFQSWFIFVNELFNPSAIKLNLLRPFAISPFNIPEPFRRWLFAAWCQPARTLTFAKLRILFTQRKQLPACIDNETGIDRWIAAMETGLQQLQLHVHNLSNSGISLLTSNDLTNLCKDLMHRTKILEQQMVDHLESHRKIDNQLLAVLNSRSWRLMAPYRYIGLQFHLLWKYGIKNRIFHAAKLVLRTCYIQINKYPMLKSWIIYILHKIGFYTQSRQFVQYLFPFSSSTGEETQKTVYRIQHKRLLDQLNEIHSIPEKVRNIYRNLDNKR